MSCRWDFYIKGFRMGCNVDWVVMVVMVCMLLEGLDSRHFVVCLCMGVVVDSISLVDRKKFVPKCLLLCLLLLLGNKNLLLELFFLGLAMLVLGLVVFGVQEKLFFWPIF